MHFRTQHVHLSFFSFLCAEPYPTVLKSHIKIPKKKNNKIKVQFKYSKWCSELREHGPGSGYGIKYRRTKQLECSSAPLNISPLYCFAYWGVARNRGSLAWRLRKLSKVNAKSKVRQAVHLYNTARLRSWMFTFPNINDSASSLCWPVKYQSSIYPFSILYFLG